MQDIRAATEDEVIVAWLQAEFESPRYTQSYPPCPWESAQDVAYVKHIIEAPGLNDPAENYIRKTKLALARGIGWGRYIFTGLSDDIEWRRVRFTTDEIGQMLYANNVATWSHLAPTLRVSQGAERVQNIQPPAPYEHILVLAQQIHSANPPPTFPELICLQRPDGRISVMEGHSRATAFVMEAAKFPDGIEAYFGSGPSVANWIYL